MGLSHELLEATVGKAAAWIEWVKGLESSQDRPTGFRVARLKREKLGKFCAFCRSSDMVGVEHIIPRGAGGPKFVRWNLAWSCYRCNEARGSDIGLPNRSVPMIGWLGKAFRSAPSMPSSSELKSELR